MSARGTESDFELTTIERLEQLEYVHQHGEDVVRSHEEVVLKDTLRSTLARRYPDLPPRALDEAVTRISRPEGVDTLRRNLAFHLLLTRGFDLPVEMPGGKVEHRHIYPIN